MTPPKRRPYTKSQREWCDEILREWAAQLARRPRKRVVVSGGTAPIAAAIQKGGRETGKETARGVETRPQGKSRAPFGYVVDGLTGVAATADYVVLQISGEDMRCAWVLRAEYGLLPDLPVGADTRQKANHLGAYVDGQHWPASAYMQRLNDGLKMFAVGYKCALG